MKKKDEKEAKKSSMNLKRKKDVLDYYQFLQNRKDIFNRFQIILKLYYN